MSISILDDQLIEPTTPRRRELLPLWIKLFIWLFFILSLLAPIALILGISEFNIIVSLYGLETNQLLSNTGLCLTAILTLKGAVSYGLWTEKDWAIYLGRTDAFLGITICVIVMCMPLFSSKGNQLFDLRFELIPLAFYHSKLAGISYEWNQRVE
ncbi:MAG: hypothetical protein AB8F78_03675 [Saprospiraceae bacterium]